MFDTYQKLQDFCQMCENVFSRTFEFEQSVKVRISGSPLLAQKSDGVNDIEMRTLEREGTKRKSVTTGSSRFEWPSQSSILESPERKRYRHSVSFADSGLGSSLFGSPPYKSVTVPDATATLKTPTRKSSPSMSSDSSSPLKSFMHVSPLSDAFVPPQDCSPPSKIRLSNPGQAVEYRFSMTGLPAIKTPINMADDGLNGAIPSTSFKESSRQSARRSLRSQLTRATVGCENERSFDENDDNTMDTTVPYAVVETPSKGFKNEVNMDIGFPLLSSTPLQNPATYDASRNHSFMPSYYAIPEQATGPLESSLCEPVDQFRVPAAGYNSPVKKAECRPPVLLRTRTGSVMETGRMRQKVEIARLTSKSTTAAANRSRMCLREANSNKPFKPPTKALKVNSRKWLQIACGGTPHQVEMTRMAKFFLGSGQVTFSQ